jgi:hypothetical protein
VIFDFNIIRQKKNLWAFSFAITAHNLCAIEAVTSDKRFIFMPSFNWVSVAYADGVRESGRGDRRVKKKKFRSVGLPGIVS